MLLKVRLLQDVPALDAEKGDVVEASQHEADFWVRTGSAELVDELVEEVEVVDEEPKSGDESADEGEDEAAPEEDDESDEELDEELDGIAVEE